MDHVEVVVYFLLISFDFEKSLRFGVDVNVIRSKRTEAHKRLINFN